MSAPIAIAIIAALAAAAAWCFFHPYPTLRGTLADHDAMEDDAARSGSAAFGPAPVWLVGRETCGCQWWARATVPGGYPQPVYRPCMEHEVMASIRALPETRPPGKDPCGCAWKYRPGGQHMLVDLCEEHAYICGPDGGT